MKKKLTAAAAALVLAALAVSSTVGCNECVSWNVEHSVIRNGTNADLTLIVCDKAKPAGRTQEFTVKKEDLVDIEWFAERDYDRFRVSGCDDSNNRKESIELAIAAVSQATVKLCEHDDGFWYRVVAAADACPTDYSEVIDNCP